MRAWLPAALILLLTLAPSPASAGAPAFDKKASGAPELLQRGPERPWCPICGMSLKGFWKTSHAVVLQDGSARQYCSLRCLAGDLDVLGAAVAAVKVTDAATEKLTDARTAHYVVESAVPGTMSRVSKLAFATKEAAETHIASYGGRLVDFDTALKLAREHRAEDDLKRAAKMKLKIHPAGEKLWKTRCAGKLDPAGYPSLARLKTALRGPEGCPELTGKPLQMVTLYLWNVARGGAATDAPLEVGAKEKCPVCGMFVAKYPHWVAQLVLPDGGHLSFDGVKDLVKHYAAAAASGEPFAPTAVRVTDYYSLAGIPGADAFYVIGSDVLGPMGHEPIPFRTRAHAEMFAADHGGEKILTFSELDAPLMKALDARK